MSSIPDDGLRRSKRLSALLYACSSETLRLLRDADGKDPDMAMAILEKKVGQGEEGTDCSICIVFQN